ncbi:MULTISPECIES: hypothetical protein [Levilactobacillus]|uniref:Uncharacterized protein n=1 Tax=Levilactobacillus fujinensis TaxID=2486024 RepID=A0ABW1TK54_9LACO|nr:MULTISPECIES: hypothetical protein [Levilactobacillus]
MTTEEFTKAMRAFGYEVVPSGNDLLFEKRDCCPAPYGFVDTRSVNGFEVREVPSQVLQVILKYAGTAIAKRSHI